MSEHTPGPWDWLAVGANASGGHHLYLIDANNRKIAALWGGADEKMANANLMSAAPDMRVALKELLDWIGDNTLHGDETVQAETARAALAKADAKGASA